MEMDDVRPELPQELDDPQLHVGVRQPVPGIQVKSVTPYRVDGDRSFGGTLDPCLVGGLVAAGDDADRMSIGRLGPRDSRHVGFRTAGMTWRPAVNEM